MIYGHVCIVVFTYQTYISGGNLSTYTSYVCSIDLCRSQAKCCDFGVRITAQITLSAPTLVPGAQPQITVFAGQLAANHSFFQDKSQNGGGKSQFRSHFLAGGRLDLSWNHTSHPTLVLLDPACFRAQYPLLCGCS